MTPSKTDPRPPRDFPDPPDEEPWDGPVPMEPPEPSKTVLPALLVDERKLEELWSELVMDASASDGPISDQDVKNAVKRWRPRIEAALLAERKRLNRYESALNRIAYLGMDAPAFGPEPADFYRDQLMTAIGVAARALQEGSAGSATPEEEQDCG